MTTKTRSTHLDKPGDSRESSGLIHIPWVRLQDLRWSTRDIHMYNEKSKECRVLMGSEDYLIFDARCDDEKHIWVASEKNGFFIYDLNKDIVERHFLPDSTNLGQSRVRFTYEDQAGRTFIGTGDGLYQFFRSSNYFIHYAHNKEDKHSSPKGEAMAMHEDSQGRLWVAFQYGLAILDVETGRFYQVKHHPSDKHSIAGEEVWNIFEDHTGGALVWDFLIWN